MRALLTGIGGFIGIHTFAHIMQNTDWYVVGVDSWRHKGESDRLNIVLRDHPEWSRRLLVFTHDLRAPFSPRMMRAFGEIDYIISMAAESHVERSIDDPRHFIENNVAVAVTMLELARSLTPKTFIQISTDEVYGAAPIGTKHKEWAPILPSNPYSASKAAQEAAAIAYWRTFKVPVVLTNTMNNFGEMQDSEKYPAMVLRKVVRGETVSVHGKAGEIGSRFYLHARNHADALLFILGRKPALHSDGHIDFPDRYNIVGERELDNLELAQMIAEMAGATLNYKLVDFHKTRPGHDRRYALDGSKLAALGWKPPISLEESLKASIEWTLRNPEWI